jgi:hypothetical protein
LDRLDFPAKTVQLRALLEHVDALSVDASTIRRKLDAQRLTPALARTWLRAMREQVREIEELIAAVCERLADRGDSPPA